MLTRPVVEITSSSRLRAPLRTRHFASSRAGARARPSKDAHRLPRHPREAR